MRWSRPRLGAMKERLAELAEEARPFRDDQNTVKPSFDDETARRVWENLHHKSVSEGGSRYEYDNQRELGFTRIPDYAPQQTRQIALHPSWKGEENYVDLSHRMLQDSNPVSKIVKASTLEIRRNKRPSVSDRLSRAREGTLDYRLNKDADSRKLEEDPLFSQQYKDRFLGGSGSGTTMSLIESIASQRIEDAIARNEFRDLPRGESQNNDLQSSSPFIDTTEYFLNKMIQRQGAAPPWVEKQATVNRMTQQLRHTLLDTWVSRAVNITLERYVSGMSDAYAKIERAKQVASDLRHHPDAKAWEVENKAYHDETIKDLNSTIRGYNLQAPGSARKGYLDVERELDLAYTSAVERIPLAVEKFLVPKEKELPPTIDKGDLWTSEIRNERSENHYGLKELWKDLWGASARTES